MATEEGKAISECQQNSPRKNTKHSYVEDPSEESASFKRFHPPTIMFAGPQERLSHLVKSPISDADNYTYTREPMHACELYGSASSTYECIQRSFVSHRRRSISECDEAQCVARASAVNIHRQPTPQQGTVCHPHLEVDMDFISNVSLWLNGYVGYETCVVNTCFRNGTCVTDIPECCLYPAVICGRTNTWTLLVNTTWI